MEIFLSTVLWTIAGILVSFVLIRLFIWFMKGEIEDLQNLAKGYKDLSDAVDKWKECYENKKRDLEAGIEEYEKIVQEIRNLYDELEELKEDDKS